MNKTANYSLTIVIPVYNEEDNIKRLLRTEAWNLFRKRARTLRIFIISV